jgi:hypothetical protein
MKEMKMARRRMFVWAATLALLAACASRWDVDSYAAPDGNVAAKQTFYFGGGDFGNPASIDPTVVATATSQIRAVVVAELVRKGFTQVDSAEGADMVVTFQVAGTQRFVPSDARRIGAPSPTGVLMPGATQPPPASYVPREIRVRDGSVLVFIDDRASGRLLWRGSVSAETRSGSPEQGVRLITEMARDIARQVPARAGTAR